MVVFVPRVFGGTIAITVSVLPPGPINAVVEGRKGSAALVGREGEVVLEGRKGSSALFGRSGEMVLEGRKGSIVFDAREN